MTPDPGETKWARCGSQELRGAGGATWLVGSSWAGLGGGLEGAGSPQSVSGGGRPCSGCGFWAGLESLTPGVPGSGWRTRFSLAQWPSVCCLSFLTCKVGASAVLTSEGHRRVSRLRGAGASEASTQAVGPQLTGCWDGELGDTWQTRQPLALPPAPSPSPSAHVITPPPRSRRGSCVPVTCAPRLARGWARIHGERSPWGALGGRARSPAPRLANAPGGSLNPSGFCSQPAAVGPGWRQTLPRCPRTRSGLGGPEPALRPVLLPFLVPWKGWAGLCGAGQ